MICQLAQIKSYGNATKSTRVVAVLAEVRNLVKCEQLNIFLSSTF